MTRWRVDFKVKFDIVLNKDQKKAVFRAPDGSHEIHLLTKTGDGKHAADALYLSTHVILTDEDPQHAADEARIEGGTKMKRVGIRLFPIMVWLVVAGCATQNTLAQDLAWERWQKCSNIPTITLQEIRPDGQIWIYYGSPSGLTAARECLQKAAAEQAQGRAVLKAPEPVVSSPQQIAKGEPPAVSGPPLAPVWKVGDEWAYRWESPQGKGTFVWSVDREEVLDGVPHYVIKTGTREIFYRVSDLAFTQETLEGRVLRKVRPSDWRFVAFPLSIGKSWDMNYTEERPVDRQTEEIQRTCRAEAEEEVTVPAGTFRTIRIVCQNKQTGARVLTVWYAPEVRHMVQEDSVVTGGRRFRELIIYRLK